MTEEELAAIEARANAATEGPWHWGGNVDTNLIRLYTRENHGRTVMDFVRWGMRDAAPRFCDGFLMHRADGMVRFEVCADATERSDSRVYRGDFTAVLHPDAEFIATARADVPALIAEVRRLTGDLTVAVHEATTARADLASAEEKAEHYHEEIVAAHAERDRLAARLADVCCAECRAGTDERL